MFGVSSAAAQDPRHITINADSLLKLDHPVRALVEKYRTISQNDIVEVMGIAGPVTAEARQKFSEKRLLDAGFKPPEKTDKDILFINCDLNAYIGLGKASADGSYLMIVYSRFTANNKKLFPAFAKHCK
jgi:hypothetical protein